MNNLIEGSTLAYSTITHYTGPGGEKHISMRVMLVDGQPSTHFEVWKGKDFVTSTPDLDIATQHYNNVYSCFFHPVIDDTGEDVSLSGLGFEPNDPNPMNQWQQEVWRQ